MTRWPLALHDSTEKEQTAPSASFRATTTRRRSLRGRRSEYKAVITGTPLCIEPEKAIGIPAGSGAHVPGIVAKNTRLIQAFGGARSAAPHR